MQGLQRPVAAPGTEVVKHRLPGREVMGQLSPGAAAARHVEDRVGDLASLPARRSATALDGRDQRLQKRPFFVREVGGVGLALALGKGHVLSLLRCPWQASLPALCGTSAQSIPFPNTLSYEVATHCCRMPRPPGLPRIMPHPPLKLQQYPPPRSQSPILPIHES